jgi:hypothetical protein
MNPAVFSAMSAYDTPFFFRFWGDQEEDIYRDYLQIASYCTREGKSTTSMKDGSGDASEGVVALFPEIGKDTTDGYTSP